MRGSIWRPCRRRRWNAWCPPSRGAATKRHSAEIGAAAAPIRARTPGRRSRRVDSPDARPYSSVLKLGAPMTANSAIGTYIEVAGHRTNLHVQGLGAPVMLLHGSGPGVSAWSNWNEVMPVLARDFHVIAPDIAGFGYTESAPDQRFDIKVWVAHLIGILDVLGLEKVSLAGNSFGGGLALAAALSHPDRIEKLILPVTPAGEFALTN